MKLLLDEKNVVIYSTAIVTEIESGFLCDVQEGEYGGRVYPTFFVNKIVEVNEIPDDFVSMKYKYVNGEFVLNPDYVEPLPPIEDRVATLESDKAEKTEVQAVWDSMAAAYSEGVNKA